MPESYRYDVFISYSRQDKGWVYEWLLPRLKDRQVKVCIDVESEEFDAGQELVNAIQSAVDNSRLTIAVLTPAYLESEWAKAEYSVVRYVRDRHKPLDGSD
jgi:hypothetical protein